MRRGKAFAWDAFLHSPKKLVREPFVTVRRGQGEEFRSEFFNFTNTPHFANPDGSVGDGSDFMTITGTTNLAREGIDERQFRFGLKLSF